MQFIENKNQWDEKVLYKARIPSGEMYIEKDKVTFNLIAPDDYGFQHHHNQRNAEEPLVRNTMTRNERRNTRPGDHSERRVRAHAYNFTFKNSNKNVEVIPSNPYTHKTNFFQGSDRSKWASDARAFNEVSYKNIYEGIDFHFYAGNNKLKYDISIAIGRDPDVIQLEYDGVDQLQLLNRKLFVKTSVNTAIEYIPEAYQIIRGKKQKINCEYVLNGNVVSFAFPDGFNKNFPVIIDPVIDFATYSGSTADNWGFTATYDDDGNFYAGGIVFGMGYPVSSGSYDATFNGLVDVAISKYTPDGKSLLYSTYIGGNQTETPNSMIVNSKGELVIYGVTGSANFPVTPNAYQNAFKGGWDVWFLSNSLEFTNGTDIFITVLNKNGNQLTGSTYVGGTDNEGINDYFTFNYGDEFRGEVIIDEADNIYVASNTYSNDFPLTPNAFRTNADFLETAIFKMSPDAGNMIFSSYYGGVLDEVGFSLKLDQNKNLFVAGATNSDNLPATAGAYQPTNDFIDGFITKIDSNWNVVRTTFIRTVEDDVVYLIDLDQFGKVYGTGISFGSMPISPGVFSNGNSGQFIIKLDNNLTTREMSTIFGKGDDGEPELATTAFMVDICGNIYYSGWGGGVNSGFVWNYLINGLTVTSDAMKSATDGSDFYYMVLAPDAASLLYGSYFGGNISEEHVDGGTSRFDRKGIIYQGICAGCGGNNDFPVTPGVYSATNGTASTSNPNCNMGAAKISFQLIPVIASAKAEPSAGGCAPLDIQFTNTGKGDSYFWDLGNGQTSTLEDPSTTYTTPGIYTVKLIASGSGSCNVSDTAILTIEAFETPVAGFSQTDNIINEPVKFTNLSQKDQNSRYSWDFGDGSTSSEKDPIHIYSQPGTYTVCLTTTDTLTNCENVSCKTVMISELGLVDIPNAFSPNGDGLNDILFVDGTGVSEVRLRIYNRWGQLIFESISMNIGWDGTFKGEPQDMDTYIYYLDATLTTGEMVAKKGNITLVR